MRIYLDFDDTIFDCRIQFKHALFGSLAHHTHLTTLQVESTYQHLHERFYTVEKHLLALGCTPTNCREYAQEVKTELKSHLPNMVLPEAKQFLEQVDRSHNELQLLTFGDPEFQAWKVEGTGLAPYFAQIHYVTSSKSVYLLDRLHEKQDSRFVFVDNQPAHQTDIQMHFPQAHIQGSVIGLIDWLTTQNKNSVSIKPDETQPVN